MKNLKKAEITVIALTLLCLCFTTGYFVGRGTTVHIISFDKLASTSEAAAVSAQSGDRPALDLKDSVTAASDAASDTTVAVSDVSMAPVSDTSAAVSVTAPGNSEKINVNTASLAKLDELPGIGPVLAQSIIDYREKIGSFKSIEQIMEVDGIGEKKYAAMKDMITLG